MGKRAQHCPSCGYPHASMRHCDECGFAHRFQFGGDLDNHEPAHIACVNTLVDAVDRLRDQNADLRDEVALLTEDYQRLCGESGHDFCKCVIPCHIGCVRCDADVREVTP